MGNSCAVENKESIKGALRIVQESVRIEETEGVRNDPSGTSTLVT